MSTSPTIYKDAVDKGLEGIVACTTKISAIFDATLLYRGYTIEDLSENSTFEEVIFLLWNDRLPRAAELETFRKDLVAAAQLAPVTKDLLKALSKADQNKIHPMDYLRTAVSTLSFVDPDVRAMDEAANRRKALRLTGQMLSIVAGYDRLRKGKDLIDPVAGKSMAWNFLNMLSGSEKGEPNPEHVKIIDTALILHADHEINCSAFSARVTASSLSDLHSAIVSAIGTLKGPLHGGANEAVIKMLQEIGTIEKARAYVEQALEGKQKVMGIGHRVYKNGDPRARILRKISERVTKEAGVPHLYEMSVLIDETMLEKKGLMPNVDFYSATVYHCLGLPHDVFTPFFAVSRIAGWCAHVLEQSSNNRIYRPRGDYQGKNGLVWSPAATR